MPKLGLYVTINCSIIINDDFLEEGEFDLYHLEISKQSRILVHYSKTLTTAFGEVTLYLSGYNIGLHDPHLIPNKEQDLYSYTLIQFATLLTLM